MLRKYYDMYIKLHSTQEEEINKILDMAKMLQLDGIMLMYEFSTPQQAKEVIKTIDERKEEGLEVMLSTLIDPKNLNPSTFTSFRKEGIAVASQALNLREVVEKGPDIIIPSDYTTLNKQFNQVLSSLLYTNHTALIISLHHILSLSRYKQILSLNSLRLVYKLQEKHPFPLIVGSGATKPAEMRAGRDLASLSYIITQNLEQALKTTSTNPETLIKKIKTYSNPQRKQAGIYELE